MISDTIGAIAIDRWGNIAAGSSSGGIGMKHRGRVGPAALIGIGTHVIPVDPTDPDGTTVACVTSGTGELIASAFVAYTLSQRIYFNQKKCENGRFEQEVDQVVISEYFKNEFTSTYL
jgi:taspase (threonine aspartase 1)